MATRKFLDIERMPLIGGSLCLDFMNTTGARDGVPRERLNTYDDLVTFCIRANLITDDVARKSRRVARRESAKARRVLNNMIRLREILYGLFRAAVDKTVPEANAICALQKEWSRAAARRLLVWDGVPSWEWNAKPEELDHMRWPIVYSAAQLLGSEDLGRLRKCGECDWLFLDNTKNQSRRFCKRLCGDRVKSRRYYERHSRTGATP